MINKLKSIFQNTVSSVKTFKEDPINSLAYLLVIAMVLTSTISGIVSYIKFVGQGGYTQQIELVKNNGAEGIFAGFTNGTVGLITSGITSKIMCGLVFAEIVVMFVSYFKNSNKVKRIIMIVDLILCLIEIALATVVFWIEVGELIEFKQYVYKYLLVFDGITSNPSVILITYLVVATVSLITFLVLVFTTKECSWMMKYTTLALLFFYIAVPLFFLALENIIPLIAGAIALMLLGVGIIWGFKRDLNFSGDTNSSPSKSESNSGWFSSNDSTAKEKNKKVEKYQKKKEYNLNTNFWRDKGGLGVLTPSADCIYFKNNIDATDYVCTVLEFEKGDVAIYNNGKRITNIPGCKIPER